VCVAPYVFNSNWVNTLSVRRQVGESCFHGAISDCLDDGRYSRAPLLKDSKISSNLVVLESCQRNQRMLHYFNIMTTITNM